MKFACFSLCCIGMSRCVGVGIILGHKRISVLRSRHIFYKTFVKSRQMLCMICVEISYVFTRKTAVFRLWNNIFLALWRYTFKRTYTYMESDYVTGISRVSSLRVMETVSRSRVIIPQLKNQERTMVWILRIWITVSTNNFRKWKSLGMVIFVPGYFL